MSYLFFAGEREELKTIESELRLCGQKVIPLSSIELNNSWTEAIQPIVFAILSSTVVATAIQEYFKNKNTSITIESEKDGEKLKITCPKSSVSEIKKMLIDLNLIKSEK